MAKNRNGVVVASRRYSSAIGPRPFSAIGLRDLTDFGFAETRPAFLQRGQALSPVITRARFNPQVVIEIAEMNLGGFAKGHLCRHFAVSMALALSMLF